MSTQQRPDVLRQPGLDNRTVSRVVAAILMPIGPACVAVIRFIIPDPGRPGQNPAEVIESMQLVHILGLPALFTLLPGIYAALHLTRRYRPRLTAWTTAFLVPAYLGMTALGALDYFTLAGHQVNLDLPTMSRVTDRLFALTAAPTIVFVVGHVVGTILLGVITVRAQLAPAWVGALLILSQPLHVIAIVTTLPPLDLTGWGLTALGMGFLAIRVLHTPNEQWDLPPYDHEGERSMQPACGQGSTNTSGSPSSPTGCCPDGKSEAILPCCSVVLDPA